MRLSSFLTFSVESVFRNRRRSLQAILGVVLAVSMLSGSLVAVDSTATGLMDAAIKAIPVDYVGYSYVSPENVSVNESSYSLAIMSFEGVHFVKEAVPIALIDGWTYLGNSNLTSAGATMFLPRDSSRLFEEFKVDGELPDSGGAAISQVMAAELGLGVGDRIICSRLFAVSEQQANGTWAITEHYANVSLLVSEVWSQERLQPSDLYRDQNWQPGSVSIAGYWNPVVLNMGDSGQITGPLTAYSPLFNLETRFLVWADRPALVNLADLQGTLNRLTAVTDRLAFVGGQYRVYFYDSEIAHPLLQLRGEIEAKKATFIALSLPVAALGVYLSIVGVDIGIPSRRREMGVLKSRGASSGQAFSMVFVESMILGTIAGVFGFLLGLIVSRFIFTAATYLQGGTAEVASVTFSIQPQSIALAIVFGVLLMAISSYRPMKKASKLTTAEALHYYVPTETETQYDPRWDFVLLFLAALSITCVIEYSTQGISYRGAFVVELALIVLVAIGIRLLPIVPFILSVSLIRLLTRGTHRIYSKFTILVKPWTKELHYLVEKNIARNPRRASNICTLVSLTIAFGLFISITLESSISYERRLVQYDVGADIKVEGTSRGNGSTISGTLDILSSLQSMNDVAESTAYYPLLLTVNAYSWGNAVSINSSEYEQIVGSASSWFIQPRHFGLQGLREEGTAVMTADFAMNNGLTVGDHFQAGFEFALNNGSTGHVEFPLTIIGIVRGLPGLSQSMIIDEATFNPVSVTVRLGDVGVLIHAREGSNHEALANNVTLLFESAGLKTTTKVMSVELARIERSPDYGALANFLYVEYALSFIIMSLGIGLVVFITVSERERELACIMARGSSSSQLRRILMGESVTLMSLSNVVGLSVGLSIGFLYNYMAGRQTSAVVPHDFVFTYASWMIIVASIVVSVLASYAATYRAQRINLAEILRVRCG